MRQRIFASPSSYPPLAAAPPPLSSPVGGVNPKLALRGDKTQRLVRPDQCDFTMQSEREGGKDRVGGVVGAMGGPHSGRMAEHQRVLRVLTMCISLAQTRYQQ